MAKVVTALKVQKKNPRRVNVYLDGEFAFGLSRIAAAWLEVGQELQQDEISKLQAEDAIEVAYQKALNFLSYRSRSVHEVTQNLTKHSFSEDVITDVLERLARLGLVDDHTFAQNWVENRSTFRPRGRHALRAELRLKGISNRLIDEVLEDIDEDTLAYQAATKQTRKYRDLEWVDFRRKMNAYLGRRGFNYGIAAEVTEKVWLELQADQAEDGSAY